MAASHTMYGLTFVIPKMPLFQEKKVFNTGTENGLRDSGIEYAEFIVIHSLGGIAA